MQNQWDELTEKIVAGARTGVAEAIETHRRMRRPIVVWRDGQVAWIHPDDIEPRALPGDDDPLPTLSNQPQRHGE